MGVMHWGTVANIRGNNILLSKDHRRSIHEEWQVLYSTELCSEAFQL